MRGCRYLLSSYEVAYSHNHMVNSLFSKPLVVLTFPLSLSMLTPAFHPFG
jgi:hypothetical protein